MTNTLNIPNGALETRYPLRVTRYALRRGSALRSSGDGLIVSTSS
jgi:N-methylhydantoinase B